jgi:3-hydroxyisobutyrate dehydrogenase
VTQVGFIGLGRMGLPMTRCLVRGGFAVRGFDIDASRSAEVPEIVPAESSAAAAHDADIVVLMLPDSSAVERVVLLDGVLAAMRPGRLVVDMSSSDPMRTRVLAATAAESGIAFVDAPVSGGVRGADLGELTIMVGGAVDDVARARSMLRAMGRQVNHVGPVGAGHAVKALNNLLGATSLLMASEALEVGRAFGLDLPLLVDTFNASTGRSWSTEHKLPSFVLPESFDSGFDLALMVKDIRIARDLASSVGIVDGAVARVVDVWGEAMDALGSGADHTEIARWVRGRGDVARGRQP